MNGMCTIYVMTRVVLMIKHSSIPEKNIRVDKGTVGGDTYYITLPKELDERALCFRRISTDHSMRCTNPAGYKTYHNGTGACAYHGGNAGEKSAAAMVKTGRFSTATKMRLANSVQQYIAQDRAQLLDLTEQLAISKAIFDEFVENFPEPSAKEYGLQLNRFMSIISALGNLVEKMSRMDNRNTITTAQVLYLRATVADILMKYLKDPYDRERAAKELASRMGGEVNSTIDIKSSEVSMNAEVL